VEVMRAALECCHKAGGEIARSIGVAGSRPGDRHHGRSSWSPAGVWARLGLLAECAAAANLLVYVEALRERRKIPLDTFITHNPCPEEINRAFDLMHAGFQSIRSVIHSTG